MIKTSFKTFINGLTERASARSVSRIKLIEGKSDGFYAWDGRIYHSDIVRACIRPKVKQIGKLVAKHIRETVTAEGKTKLAINPEPYIRFLLEEPNPHMSGQMLLEKMATQLCLNNNAFALIIRDDLGMPREIYPLSAVGADALYDKHGELFICFTLSNGKRYTFPYCDLIHLRQDYGESEIFGDSVAGALAPLMEIVSTTDQGIVKAVKNSSVIRWLLKFTTSMRKEDIEERTKEFATQFMDLQNGTGVAGVDTKADAVQIRPDNYVPNASQVDRTTERIRQLFNTNVAIITANATENELNAYFDAEIEPVAIQLNNEFTRKIFTRRERACGNKIIFENTNWDSMSSQTKLALVALVDRGAMTPNEWRATFNLAPLPEGDEPIRRLDTQPIEIGGE